MIITNEGFFLFAMLAILKLHAAALPGASLFPPKINCRLVKCH